MTFGEMESKQCGTCKIEKDSSEFHKDKTNKSGLRYSCKECNKGRHRSRSLMTLYGLTVEEYDSILIYQGNGCALCGKPCSTGRNLAVDHDHDTGQIRGLLCHLCNRRVIGNLKIEQIEKLYSYVHESPAELVFGGKRYVPQAYIRPRRRRKKRIIKRRGS